MPWEEDGSRKTSTLYKKSGFKMKGWGGYQSSPMKQSELPEGVDEPKSILGSEAGGSGFEREMKTKTGSGSPTDDMSRTHTYEHKYDKKGKLLKGYPKWVEKT